MANDFDEKELYIGRKAQELRGLLKIKWPVEHGIVSASHYDITGTQCDESFLQFHR